jgi:hypothetical protein
MGAPIRRRAIVPLAAVRRNVDHDRRRTRKENAMNADHSADSPRLFLSEEEAATQLGIHRTTLRALALAGRSPIEPVSLTAHKRIYRLRDLERLGGVAEWPLRFVGLQPGGLTISFASSLVAGWWHPKRSTSSETPKYGNGRRSIS